VVAGELAATPAAADVPQAMADTYTRANGLHLQGRYCDGLPVLDMFAALPATGPTAQIVATANTDRAAAMYQCGLARYQGSAYTEAIEQLNAYLAAYPNDGQAAQARSLLIAATVLEEAGGAPLPVPAPLTNNVTGPIPVTVYNNSPYEQHVYLVGPTAHEFVLPPCPECRERYAGPLITELQSDPCADLAGKPSLQLLLGPGTYTRLATSEVGPTPVQADVVEYGYEYTTCVFVETYF
jgi:hypothetical protein